MKRIHWQHNPNHQLTKRETESVARAAEGDSHKEAAREMNCAPTTVKRFWLTATEKTGARNRCELVAIAIHQGWITPLCILFCLLSLGKMDALRRPPRPPAVRMARAGRSRELHELAGIRT
ncbi:response regulator transcription factor [Endozoicomonas sp. 2B-B]